MPQNKIVFNYAKHLGRDGKTGELVYAYRPLIWLQLVDGETSTDIIKALLDSGSDKNLFPAAFGLQVGIDVRKGEKVEVTGIGGHEIVVYRHKVKMVVLSKEPISFETEIDFSYDHSVPILGREGFFDKFEKVEFREKKKVVELTV